MYLVYYSEGEYEDYREFNLFVTENEKLAKDYCNKFNTLKDKMFDFYAKRAFDSGIWDINSERVSRISDIHLAEYYIIQVRN